MMNVMMIFAAGKRRRDLGRFVRHHVLPRVSNLSLFASNTEQHVKVQARVRFFAFCALLLAPTFTRNHRTQKKKVQRVASCVSLQSFKRIDFGGQNTVRENPFATSFSSALCVARVACVLFVRKQRYGETRLSYSLLVSRDALSSASFVCACVCVCSYVRACSTRRASEERVNKKKRDDGARGTSLRDRAISV